MCLKRIETFLDQILAVLEIVSCKPRLTYSIAIRHSTDNIKIPILHALAFFSLNHILGTRFTTDDFANFYY